VPVSVTGHLANRVWPVAAWLRVLGMIQSGLKQVREAQGAAPAPTPARQMLQRYGCPAPLAGTVTGFGGPPSASQYSNHCRIRPRRSTSSHGSPERDSSWVERG
jgi:hypothetical protein